MNIFENIAEILGVKDLVYKPTFKATLVGSGAGYFECVLGIKSYSEQEIVLLINGGEVLIKGEELFVKKFCEGDVAVCGKIRVVERI